MNNGRIKLEAQAHVVREQHIEINLSPADIEPDVTVVKVIVRVGNSRPRTMVIPDYVLQPVTGDQSQRSYAI
jgi:hypothetical protein